MRSQFIFTILINGLLQIVAAGGLGASSVAGVPPHKVEIAALLSTTGVSQPFGAGSLEGVRFAVEEANASGKGPHIDLKIYDDESSPEAAKAAAGRIVSSPAILVVGPSATVTSHAAGEVFAGAGLPSITTTATSDTITDHATTFRMISKNSEQGELLANYLYRAMGHRRAAVMVMDDGYGRTLEKGFRSAAERLGIVATYHVFKSGENLEEKAAAAAPEIAGSPVVLAMLASDGTRILTALQRLGNKGPFLGGETFGIENLNSRFAGTPEEKEEPGFFCENLFATSPMLLDSVNVEILTFAERFKARFGHDPGWVTVAGYDAGRLAIEVARNMDAKASDPASQRAAALKSLLALNDLRLASPGLLGPLAFDAERGRKTAMRICRFVDGRLESAPLQIFRVSTPHKEEIKSGAVFEVYPGSYARLQQVVQTGIYVNEISWIDQVKFTFAADFYVWLRFAKNPGPDAADPTELRFPDLLVGQFDREHPIRQWELEDGTCYRLWRVRGEFRNQFDLHRYPFDRQRLNITFFNAKGAAHRILYALDQSAPDLTLASNGTVAPSGASAEAFRSLSQWKYVDAKQQREIYVAKSALGDRLRVGQENFRELSGYGVSIILQRRSISTVIKTLLPLLLMTCIMYASLHFPPILVQPKIAVAITAVLTGVVLLNTVNAQLGAIGYPVHVEFAFYLYFGLGLLHIVSVLTAEHMRAIGKGSVARKIDFWIRIIFICAVTGLFGAALIQLRTS